MSRRAPSYLTLGDIVCREWYFKGRLSYHPMVILRKGALVTATSYILKILTGVPKFDKC